MPNEIIETTARDVTAQTNNGGGALQEMSIEQVVARVQKVKEIHKRIMQKDIHYGVIPGTPKPTLLKPGAEILLLTFMLDPQYENDIRQDGPNREIISRCVLYHAPSGNRLGSGTGSCSTYESKYAYRKAPDAVCPACGHGLMKSQYPPPSWYCNPKNGGCKTNFPLNDARIKASGGGRIPNPDLADQYNTVLKMANKRALIAAILNATAASEIFTQDLEDFKEEPEAQVEEPPKAQPVKQTPVSDFTGAASVAEKPVTPPPAPAAASSTASAPAAKPREAAAKPLRVVPDAPAATASTPKPIYISGGQVAYLMKKASNANIDNEALLDLLTANGCEMKESAEAVLKVLLAKDFKKINDLLTAAAAGGTV